MDAENSVVYRAMVSPFSFLSARRLQEDLDAVE